MRRVLLLFLVLFPITLLAQRERNYIYLLDCTKSMTGYGGSPKIWNPTREYLKNELSKHKAGTTLHIVPFQGSTLPAFNFDASSLNWNEIDKELQKHVQKVTNTNICDAWDATDKYIDKHKDNYIILLTDGLDNVHGMAAVSKKLSDWCGKYPNTYAFYVQLTEAAIDQRVAKVIDICKNEFVVDASKGIPVFGSFDSELIYANTLNLDRIHRIGFSSVGKYAAKAVCTDPYFDVKLVDNKIVGGIAPIRIEAKQPIAQINTALPDEYNFSFEIKSEEVTIFNPTLSVIMTNKPERSLELLSEETDLGKASFYDSFLFWGASNPDTLSVDLKALFNNEAKKDGSTIELLVSDNDGEKDYRLLYNNQPVDNDKIIIASNANSASILSLIYNPAAKEGKRYLTINVKEKHNIDKVNDQPVDKYQLTLRSNYDVNWNPLKIILYWLGIIILAGVLLWLLIIKYFIYPPIGVKTILINDPYFSRINVKGKRRVVFTNKKVSQGLISRIFTGEILYKKNEIWTSPLVFESGAKRKTLKVIRTKDYTFDPYSSILKAPNEYVVENTNTGTKIKISIN